MQYREIGKTGCQAGIIGLGCEHLDGKPYAQVKETIDAALEGGVNLLDVFMPGQAVREHIARALGERRTEVMIQGHIGATDVNQQYDISRDLPTVKRYFEQLLAVFGYIDFGMLFFIDSEEDYRGVFETGVAEYAQALRKRGDIRHIGFSSHNPQTAMRVIETGVPELLMFSINPAFDMLPAGQSVFDTFGEEFDSACLRGLDPSRAALYTLCESRGVGITVMKALGAGKLLSSGFTLFAKPLTVPQCIHYALSRPAVASVLPGCASAAEMRDALRYLELDDAQRDYAETLGTVQSDFQGNCVYCSHCQPCPAEIDIARVHKYLDIARLNSQSIPAEIRAQYRAMAKRGKDCSACMHCELRCPFGVPVAANMALAEKLLG